MSSTQEKPLDLSVLNDKYEIIGELAGRDNTRFYAAKRTEDRRDVLIAVMRAAADVAQGKAIAQYAADAKLLTTLSHPNMPRVLEGRWIGDDSFALITDRVQGTALAELLKGERLPNARVAAILADVDGVLEWARGERLSHRNVTPEGIWIERGTGKSFVWLSPTESPKTNRPDGRDDARTIGVLARQMLGAKPVTAEHDGTLLDMRPDLPRRVVEATEKVAACTINDEQPDIAAFLASIAMADAIKEGEVEVERVEAEFRAQMKAEREKWEAEQEACQVANEMQSKKFAEERAEYERRAAKEREQLAAARGEIDARRAEVQQARAELDQARAAYKQKKSELEARSKQVDKHMAELEKQKRSLEKRTRQLERRAEELEERNRELRQLASLAAAGTASQAAGESSPTSLDGLLARINHADEINRPTKQVDVVTDQDLDPTDEPPQDDVAVMEEAVAADEEVHAPWMPIESTDPWTVPLETAEPARAMSYEAAALPVPEPGKPGRPKWVLPASAAGVVVLLAGLAIATSRRDSSGGAAGTVAATPAGVTVRADTAAMPSGSFTDSAAGVVAPLSDSARFTALRDSIIAADAAKRAARLARAAAAAREAEAARDRPLQFVTDSNGVTYFNGPPRLMDSVRRADSLARARSDTTARRDTVRRDTTIRRDTTRRDTLRVRPDTTRSGRLIP